MATTPRSPWCDLPIPIRFGSELPVLLRHDRWPTTLARLPWRPVTNDHALNKPRGGLWTAPAILPEGKWRPIPRRSTWSEWCETEGGRDLATGWHTQIFPDPAAPFAVINCAADAVALYEAFPDEDNPIPQFLAEQGFTGHHLEKAIDWQALLSSGVAGVYLTRRGIHETRLPDMSIVPSLNTWDLPTVWFGRRAFRVGKTWKTPPVKELYDDGELLDALAALGSEIISEHVRGQFHEELEGMKAEVATAKPAEADALMKRLEELVKFGILTGILDASEEDDDPTGGEGGLVPGME
ncbi:hypothetical protein ACFPC0_10725 [Streptomyces andamanensis]|uniref:Uncharacterized protein n=1 Tax=Streptomyces andamanensis TaxID=1565035 RepID=A0ABV8TCJ5_9ACTN